MTRYERVKERLQIIKNVDPEALRICKAKGGCACRGCAGEVNGVRVKQHELDLFNQGKL